MTGTGSNEATRDWRLALRTAIHLSIQAMTELMLSESDYANMTSIGLIRVISGFKPYLLVQAVFWFSRDYSMDAVIRTADDVVGFHRRPRSEQTVAVDFETRASPPDVLLEVYIGSLEAPLPPLLGAAALAVGLWNNGLYCPRIRTRAQQALKLRGLYF
ncbi:hypothetical protein CAPTEDRAFT_216573 [Capitella teleta]|uniref:Uncharacterized protein n=1 Tax=Capitella teleta TaxID=283909 RepID=R7TVS1_CAPTE|nr:hypothetical protein CAPTEDRAFT_216573 [Capitella teleta]|eukprot:ELT95566.1 hypothetical protein CAPTEDRAFT_216573 [Capitella teleta]